jgi:hypothetical protein
MALYGSNASEMPGTRLAFPDRRDKAVSRGRASLAALLAVSGLPLLAGAWALLSPKFMLSREMTWDLLFNLAGAWHLHYGHVPHVDFHDPVGRLNFLLTLFGFHVVGPAPQAFLIGVMVVAAVVFLCATLAAWHRLPLAAAAIFAVFVTLLILMPINVGDAPDAYSFAMSYNRYGWSILSVIALILFLPPRDGGASGPAAMAAVGGLILALFYLKVTYFAVALAALGLALLVSPHIQSRWRSWTAIAALAGLNALAPWSSSYLQDILSTASAGGFRSLRLLLNKLFEEPLAIAPYLAAALVAIWLWRTGRAPLRLPAAACFLVTSGVLLLSQNAETHGLPIGMVILFLLYGQLADQPPRRSEIVAPLSLVLMLFPILSAGTAVLSLAGYRMMAGTANGLHVVTHTQLKGLAVPAEPDGLLAAFADGTAGYEMLYRARAVSPRYDLSQYEYLEMMMEAVALLEHAKGGIVVLDQVNPLPFMLGLPPTRGGNLWSGPSAPLQPADKLFAEAEYVLVAKVLSYSPWTRKALALYGPYLADTFPNRFETSSWIVYSRAPQDQLQPADDPPLLSRQPRGGAEQTDPLRPVGGLPY